jgi:large subunit ribosomal protein L32
MAVPKKRTGHSAQGHRRSNWKALKPALTKCSNCGEPVLTHTVCTACGYYKNQPVRLKDKLEQKPVKEAKKVPAETKEVKETKKVTKKAVEEKAEEQ